MTEKTQPKDTQTKLEHHNHFEVSDGDTRIVAINICTLEETEEKLITHNTPCCVLGSNICPHFYTYWNHNEQSFLQCTKLSQSNEFPRTIDVTPTGKNCPKCGKALVVSEIEGYTYKCFNCEEDFYNIEI